MVDRMESQEQENIVLWMGEQWTAAIMAGRRLVKRMFLLGLIIGFILGWII